MAVAAPKLRSASPAAPPPSRTAPPEPKKRPRDRPKAGGRTATPRKVRIDDPPAKPGPLVLAGPVFIAILLLVMVATSIMLLYWAKRRGWW